MYTFSPHDVRISPEVSKEVGDLATCGYQSDVASNILAVDSPKEVETQQTECCDQRTAGFNPLQQIQDNI